MARNATPEDAGERIRLAYAGSEIDATRTFRDALIGQLRLWLALLESANAREDYLRSGLPITPPHKER